MGAVTNEYHTSYTPPILCVKPVQAETIIAAVGICLLGLVQMEPQSASGGPLDICLKILLRLPRAIPQVDTEKIGKLPDLSIN